MNHNVDVFEVLSDLEEKLDEMVNPFDIERIKDFIALQRSIYGGACGECAA